MQETALNTADASRAKAEVPHDWLDRHSGLAIVLLCLAFAVFTIPVCIARPLWHDELFTYYIARFPNLSLMLHMVPKADLNPPLLYVLDFFTLRLPGALASEATTALAARLPSLGGGLIGSIALFVWLRRRLGALYALVGVFVLWNTLFLFYTAEDRPYALLVGFTILMMLERESGLQRRNRPAWLLLMTLLGFALVGCHFMASFILLAFLAAEAVEAWEKRRIDVPVWLCYLLPFSVMLIYHSMISGYGTLIFPRAFQPALDTPFVTYVLLGYYSWVIFVTAGIMVLMPYVMSPPGQRPARQAERIRMDRREITLLAGLLLEPLLAIAAIWRSQGAFFPRYGLPACIPIAVGTTFLLFAALGKSKAAGILTILFLSINPVYTILCNPAMVRAGHIAGIDPGPSLPDYHKVEPQLPFVVASGLTYMEMNHRESSAFLDRVYYLTDDAAATEYAHATLFEHEEQTREMFHLQARVEPLQPFEAKHRKFLVLGTFDYPEDWLLRKLKADGDQVRFLGNYPTSYKDNQLYEITLPGPCGNCGDKGKAR